MIARLAGPRRITVQRDPAPIGVACVLTAAPRLPHTLVAQHAAVAQMRGSRAPLRAVIADEGVMYWVDDVGNYWIDDAGERWVM